MEAASDVSLEDEADVYAGDPFEEADRMGGARLLHRYIGACNMQVSCAVGHSRQGLIGVHVRLWLISLASALAGSYGSMSPVPRLCRQTSVTLCPCGPMW